MYSNIPDYVLIRWANHFELCRKRTHFLDTNTMKFWEGINKAWAVEVDAELQCRYDEIREELEEFEALS